jgi:predicted GNAT family N-acyltransferase
MDGGRSGRAATRGHRLAETTIFMGTQEYDLAPGGAGLRDSCEVRRLVFVEEQGIPEQLVFDGLDDDALHVTVTEGGRVLATARIRFIGDGQAKLERMAVLRQSRRTGIGRGIVSFLSAELAGRQVQELVLHAQRDAVEFYRSCGFEERGLPFREAGIEHVRMGKKVLLR